MNNLALILGRFMLDALTAMDWSLILCDLVSHKCKHTRSMDGVWENINIVLEYIFGEHAYFHFYNLINIWFIYLPNYNDKISKT